MSRIYFFTLCIALCQSSITFEAASEIIRLDIRTSTFSPVLSTPFIDKDSDNLDEYNLMITDASTNEHTQLFETNIFGESATYFHNTNNTIYSQLPFDYNTPFSESYGICTSPITFDIIQCWSYGHWDQYNPWNITMKCLILFNKKENSSWSNEIIIHTFTFPAGKQCGGNSHCGRCASVSPTVICLNTGYVVFWQLYNNTEIDLLHRRNDIYYSILDLDGRIITSNNRLHVELPQYEIGYTLNYTLFIDAMLFEDNSHFIIQFPNMAESWYLAGVTGYYDYGTNRIDLHNRTPFIISNLTGWPETCYGLYWAANYVLSLNVSKDCCYVLPYVTNMNTESNKIANNSNNSTTSLGQGLFFSVRDIYGNNIFKNNIMIGDLNEFWGFAELSMLDEMSVKYFVSVMAWNNVNGAYLTQDAFSLNYNSTDGTYSVKVIDSNPKTIQKLPDNEDYGEISVNCLDNQIIIYSKVKGVFTQAWNIVSDKE